MDKEKFNEIANKRVNEIIYIIAEKLNEDAKYMKMEVFVALFSLGSQIAHELTFTREKLKQACESIANDVYDCIDESSKNKH